MARSRREKNAALSILRRCRKSTAHQRTIEYGPKDKRPEATWVKAHVMVGLETLVVMSVKFSGSIGYGTHDINFLKPLVQGALRFFDVRFVVADKAYLSRDILEWLDQREIEGFIPLKKGSLLGDAESPAVKAHVSRFMQDNGRRAHSVYRFRVKVEGFFSMLKRFDGGNLRSRGRYLRSADSAINPCVALRNEILCRLIIMNLRATVRAECETGETVNYHNPIRKFPATPVPFEDEPGIA